MLATEVTLEVLPELEDYIPGKFDRSSHELEDILLKDGRATDPIIVWRQDGKLVVVDGHRRLKICTKHGLEFDLLEMDFSSLREAQHYMDVRQFSRRNLTGHERAMLIGRMDSYLEQEKAAGRFNGSAGREIASKLNMSRTKVRRVMQQATAINKVAEPLRAKIVSGDVQASSATVKALSELPEREQLNAWKQVENGEFSTLSEAVTGTVESRDCDPARPAPKPARKKDKKVPQPQEEIPDTLPLDSAPASTQDVLDNATKALGMLGKAIDALNAAYPNQPRMSNVGSHISNIRNILKNWAREAA